MAILVRGLVGGEIKTTVPWSTGSVSELKEMLKAADVGSIDITDYWTIGEERSISYTQSVLGDITRTWVLTDLNGYTSGSTKYNAVIHTKHLSTGSYYMNSSDTNSGGWSNSYMRTNTMGQIYNGLPSDFRSLIKLATIISGHGSALNLTDSTQDYIWLFSEREVLNSLLYSGSAEYNSCKHLAYFQTASNIQKTGNSGATSGYWWLRTPCVNDYRFCCIKPDGNVFPDHSDTPLGVCPAAII